MLKVPNNEETEVDPSMVLHLARHGHSIELEELLISNKKIDINYTGKNKPHKGWSALHLASYFGHTHSTEVLINQGADPNIINNTGDTPLHKASLTSRVEVVKCLVRNGSKCSQTNNEGKLASQLASNEEIIYYLQAAEKVEKYKLSEEFLKVVKEGDIKTFQQMISSNSRSFDIKMSDDQGNNALHHAVMRGQLRMVILLLEHGLDLSRPNKQGLLPLDVCESQQISKLLEVQPSRSKVGIVQRFEGPLMRKKRFLGLKWQWVVLERGVISYFAKRADAATGSRRVSFRYLTEAQTMKSSENNFSFSIRFFDGSRHQLLVHQKNNPLLQRQRWIEAINGHVTFSNHFVVSNSLQDSDSEEDEDTDQPRIDIQNVLLNANIHNKVLREHIDELIPAVHRVLTFQKQTVSVERNRYLNQVVTKCQEIIQTSEELYDSFTICSSSIQQQNQKSEAELKKEKDRNRILEQALQTLATEHHNLEEVLADCKTSGRSLEEDLAESSTHEQMATASFLSDEDEFYDALSDNDSDTESCKIDAELLKVTRDLPIDDVTDASQSADNTTDTDSTGTVSHFRTRTALPVAMFSRDSFSIWHVLRQCIGKELSKITMPVIFNEPLSFIQRLSEYMEYSYLLKQASQSGCPIQRMELVTAFAVSALACQFERLGKPFNPLLGETFEYKRTDLGFHWMSEQVSHHPPVSAFSAVGTDEDHPFEFRGHINPKIRFWGKSVEIDPKGHVILHLKNHNESYTWTNPSCSVHNIVVGKLWMEQHGLIEIINLTNQMKCFVNFKSYSWFKNDFNKIEAYIQDQNGDKTRMLIGDWSKFIYSMDVETHKRYLEKMTNTKDPKPQMQTLLKDLSEDPSSNCRCLWQVWKRPKNSTKMYNMTEYAMSINQPDVDGYQTAPTDSRKRPDIRLLEDGHIEAASTEKSRLEEKQRSARKLRNKSKKEWKPRWFELCKHQKLKFDDWVFRPNYFDRDWDRCPDIF